MAQSSFYSDTPNYATDYPTQNDGNSNPNGTKPAPSSFYPNGGGYVPLAQAASVIAQMQALVAQADADAANAASSAANAATSAANAASAVQAAAGTATPLVDGTATVGTGTKWAHEDHVHPTDTSRAALTQVVRYDAAQSLTAAQKSQGRANIDALKKNYIINGAMMVSQENGSAAGALSVSGYYPADQWRGDNASSGVITAAQVASPTPGGSPNRIRLTVTTADSTVNAGDYVQLYQFIEGLRVADLKFGTASAKPVTISFGVKAPAGTYCVILNNGGSTRNYVAEYTISAGEANTDVIKSVTIPGDTSGAWPTDNTASLVVHWSLMVGSTFQVAAGSWGTTNTVGSSNQFNFMGTNGNVFELFDVSLTEGSVAPAFQVPDFAGELLLCKRYFYNGVPSARGTVLTAATLARLACIHPVPMRAAPTLTMTANLPVYDGVTTTTMSSLTPYATAAGLEFDGAGAAGLTPGRPAMVYQGAGGNLNVNARL